MMNGHIRLCVDEWSSNSKVSFFLDDAQPEGSVIYL